MECEVMGPWARFCRHLFLSTAGESPMAKMTALLMTPATLAVGLAALSWFDPFHCTVAAATLFLAALVGISTCFRNGPVRHSAGRLDRGHRSYIWSRTETRPSIYYRHVLGVMRGILLLGVVIAASLVASLIPGLQAMVLDRDRTEIELKLQALQEAGDWPAAADLIATRLERRTSRPWRQVLLLQLYESFIGAGTLASNEDAQTFFQRAADLAEREALNKDLAATHLQRLGLQGALDRQKQIASDLARKDLQREAELNRITGQMADSQRKNAGVQTQLAASRSEVQRIDSDLIKVRAEIAKARSDRARAELEMLIAWGDSLEPANPLRKAKYQAAWALSQSHGLGEAPAKARLSDLEQALQRSQPAALPAGARAFLHNVDASTMLPLTILDLAVQLPTGEAVPGLAAKDFRLTTGTSTQSPLATACLVTPLKLAQVVELLDHSNSTAGAALAAEKTGAAALPKQVQGVAQVKTIAFASKVSVLSEWSDDPSAASSAIQQLPLGGNTALRQALAQAIDELQHRDGPKAIVLFTDGRDTVGGPTMSELIDRCRKAGIVVHAIALETAELDRQSLAEITEATGGALLPAGQVPELPDRFRQAAEALRRPFYRLIFAQFPTRQPWELLIGSTNAVRVVTPQSEPKQ